MSESDPIPPDHQTRWLGPFIVAVAACAMLFWTWGTWIDVLVDFGVQLYVPWRLINGEVLYRDIAHYTGPLSMYYNALAFRLAGASLRTLVLANLPVLGGTIALVYYLMHRLGGALCATIGGLSLVTLFAFAHLTGVGNYNYVCPYEYEYTHATFLCLAGIVFLSRYLRTDRLIWIALTGLMAGLVFLTRVEFFVAIAAACALGIFLGFCAGPSARPSLLSVPVFVGAMALPALVSTLLLWRFMPMRGAIVGTLGMWPAILKGAVARQFFYRHSMGIDNPAQSVLTLITWSAIHAAFLGVFTFWSMRARGSIRRHAAAAAILGIAIVSFAWNLLPSDDWISIFRPLPVVCGVVVIVSIIRSCANQSASPDPLAAVFASFSLILLAKIFLYARVIQYGWTLAMPSTMLLIVCVFAWIPRWLQTRKRSPWPYLSGTIGAWAVVLLVHLNFTQGQIGRLQTRVGEGADQFRADRKRGGYVNSAVEIAKSMPAGKTLVCLPEGIMINYLARRRIATPYVNYNPPDLLLFGEGNMLQALEKYPPDMVMMVYKDTSEFGVPHFGVDYGQSIGRWIEQNYHPLASPPGIDLGPPERGIRLLQRKPMD